ncbi:MAG: ABC transporter substrate-binding protein [Saccharofermentanales bacterium]
MKKILALVLSLGMILSIATGCKKEPKVQTTPLVVGYAAFSEKFSPFFATTAYDQDAQSLTQVSLLTTDRSGGIIYNAIKGEKVSYNGTEYLYKGAADIKVVYDKTADITTYTMKIRKDIKFSDGHVMDADDIIFNYYVLSDPSYTGSSTIYSYDILGMKNYRMNSSNAEGITVSEAETTAAMDAPTGDVLAYINDFISGVLTSELDWVKSLYGDDNWKEKTEEFPNAKDLFADFYSIDDTYDSSTVADEATVLADVIAQYGANYKKLGENYGGDEAYFAGDISAEVNSILLKAKVDASGGDEVFNIEGIKKLSQTEVEVKVKGFSAPAVYSICGIQVAPLHYYGDAAKYDYAANKFGFERGDLSAIDAKTTAPMGAGPYKFIKYENKVVYYEASENYFKGRPIIKFLQLKETVDAEMIAGVGTGVIDVANPSGSVKKFAELKTYNTNGESTGNVITTNSVDNLGYGYIGINATNVNVGGDPKSDASKALRKGFATVYAVYRDAAIDSYYGEAASIINYPISNTSWAAPQKADSDYVVAFSKDVDGEPIYTEGMDANAKYAAAIEAAIGFFKEAGYTFDEASGKFTAAPSGAKLDYEIIIPGGGQGEHPAFAILTDTRAALETIGITLTINDPADTNVLWNTMDANDHEMWTAAWGATIDPDMYQVYHSSNGKGKGGTESNSYNIADDELDRLILEARQSADQAFRKATYKTALDIILDWAVEIPTYQRQNLVIFSTERVNIETVTPDITTYWGWMNDIELVEMVEETAG